MQDFVARIFRHRFQRVVEHVDEYALHLLRIETEIGNVRIQIFPHADILDPSVIETQRVFQDAIHVCILQANFGKAREPGKFIHEPFERIHFLDDDLDAFGKKGVEFFEFRLPGSPKRPVSRAGAIC